MLENLKRKHNKSVLHDHSMSSSKTILVIIIIGVETGSKAA